MRFFLGRDGNLSMLRIGTLVAILGVLVVVVGFILVQVDLATRRSPLQVEPFPGSEEWYAQERGANSRVVVYRIPNITAEEVATYYRGELAEFYGSAENQDCVRFPTAGNYEEFNRGEAVPPYRFSCMFDRSGFQTSQYTRVNIEPGIAANESEGYTLVEYEQFWQR